MAIMLLNLKFGIGGMVKNISDLEISENYKGLGLSYQLLDYATKKMWCEKFSRKEKQHYSKNMFMISTDFKSQMKITHIIICR